MKVINRDRMIGIGNALAARRSRARRAFGSIVGAVSVLCLAAVARAQSPSPAAPG